MCLSPAFNSISHCVDFILSQSPQGATSILHLTTLVAPWKIRPFPTASTTSFRLRFHGLGWVMCVPLNPHLGPGQRRKGQPHHIPMGQEWGSLGPKAKSTCCSQEERDGWWEVKVTGASPGAQSGRRCILCSLRSPLKSLCVSVSAQGSGQPRAVKGVKRYQTY